MRSNDDELVVDTPVVARLALVAAGVVMTAVCLWLLLGDFGATGAVVGALGTAFFGFGLVYALYRALWPKPALTVGTAGFRRRGVRYRTVLKNERTSLR